MKIMAVASIFAAMMVSGAGIHAETICFQPVRLGPNHQQVVATVKIKNLESHSVVVSPGGTTVAGNSSMTAVGQIKAILASPSTDKTRLVICVETSRS